MSKGIFEGLKVIDCASFIAAPSSATALSDFGADVIKIEPPGAGDPVRNLPNLPGYPISNHNYAWMLEGRNKKSLALDLSKPEGQAVLRNLAAEADVFITNFPPPVRKRLGVTYDDLAPLNDRLVYASFTGYGETGAEADKPGFDSNAWWARSGLMDLVRETNDTVPARSMPGMGDHPTAVALFGAIMAALYRRERTGKGGSVSTSLLANGLWANGVWMQAALFDADFSVRLQRGMRGALTELYMCRDGRWFMLAMLNYQREWPLLAEAIGKPEWLSDPRFETHEVRRANAAGLVAELEKVFIARDWPEWKELFQTAGITYGPIMQSADHMACPQVAANGFLPEIAGTDGWQTVDSPIRIEGETKRQPRLAPGIGEHTRQVLASFGYDDGAIDRMIENGAAATA